MVNLFSSFSKIKRQKIAVIGDLVLDTYTVGKAKRISPEAPVAVLHVNHEEHKAGMAGNVALNLISLGSDVVIIGRVGCDPNGEVLIKQLTEEGIATHGIIAQAGFPTPVKNRIIADAQQLVRVDHEMIVQLPEQYEQAVIESLPKLLEGVQLIAISDYGKGFITKALMSAVIEFGKERNIPVIVDPKGVDFSKYLGADIVKPNLSELYAAANLSSDSTIDQAAERVLEVTQAKTLMVTRSEYGISLFYQGGKREDYTVRAREVKDVTGAGDTVLAMLSCALASSLSIADGARLSNIAAGIAIERFGCARITLSELARRLLGENAGNKIFDEEHFFALQEALRGRRFTILALTTADGFSTQLFTTIRQLAQRENWDLLVYIRDLEPNPEVIDLLVSLHDVDYIMINSGSLRHLTRLISPEEVFMFDELQSRRLQPDEVSQL